jgi:hypothetical protein
MRQGERPGSLGPQWHDYTVLRCLCAALRWRSRSCASCGYEVVRNGLIEHLVEARTNYASQRLVCSDAAGDLGVRSHRILHLGAGSQVQLAIGVRHQDVV